MGNTEEKPQGLKLLRQPFEAHHISKLPKPTKKQTQEVKDDFKKGIRCKECGGWHHKDVIHLDYVGHAALTDRLLDADPNWNWEPMTLGDFGQPLMDKNGGLWIKLTVCGITRIGYGDADGKTGGNANKEVIGDALRNAAMRFGAALDLWHKGDLHLTDEEPEQSVKKADLTDKEYRLLDAAIGNCDSLDALSKAWKDINKRMNEVTFSKEQKEDITKAKDDKKISLTPAKPITQDALNGHAEGTA